MQLRQQVAVDPARLHKLHRSVDLVAELFVAFAERIVLDELEVPLMHFFQIRQSTTRKGTKQIQSSRRLVVGFDHIVRVGYSRLFGELYRVDDVSTVAWQFFTVFLFKVGRSRFCKLSCNTPYFDDRFAC